MYGLGGMYGGTMGMGMGGMYGSGGMGGYGLGGGMYGGGMNSGLYNSGGLGGGLYNNNNSNYGGYGSSLNNNNNNNLLGSNGLGNNNVNNNNGTGSLLDCNGNNANGQGVSLLPPPPSSSSSPNVNANELSSPINQTAALPPLNEDPADRARRLRNERRKRRQLIKQHRDQLRQVKMKARLEILGHFTNVLVQTLRSTMELFAVCFGTYYSMKAVRAFSGAQEVPPGYVRAPNGQLMPAINGSNPNLPLQQQQQQLTSNSNNSSNLVSNNTEKNVVSQGKRSK